MKEDWDSVIRQHAAVVVAAAWRILGNMTESEDVAQEVFLEAYQARDSGSVRNWSSYLRRIAVCRAIDHLRRRKPTLSIERASTLSSGQPSPQELAIANELEFRLRKSLAELPARESQVFSLRYFEDFSNSEIADHLAMTPGAVGTAMSKARRKLEAMMVESHKGERK